MSNNISNSNDMSSYLEENELTFPSEYDLSGIKK